MVLGHLRKVIERGMDPYKEMEKYLRNPALVPINIRTLLSWQLTTGFEPKHSNYTIMAQILKIKRKKIWKEIHTTYPDSRKEMKRYKLDDNSRAILLQYEYLQS